MIWDADLLYGEDDGEDTFVLCEITASPKFLRLPASRDCRQLAEPALERLATRSYGLMCTNNVGCASLGLPEAYWTTNSAGRGCA